MTCDEYLALEESSDVRHEPGGAATCGPITRHAEDNDAVTNPNLIVEVLKPGTDKYNRGERFEHYKNLDSLQQYVLISVVEHSIEVWTRGNDNHWTSATVRDGEVAELPIGARLDVRQLYETAAEPTA